MRLLAVVLAVFAVACQNNNGSNLPVNVGGGGFGGGGGFIDASVTGDSDAGAQYRVCLLTTDARGLNACALDSAGGLMVTLGSGSDAETATTMDDGSFVIDIPSGTGLYWTVTGSLVYPSTMLLGGTTIIPVLTQDLYLDRLEASNGVMDISADGGVFIKVVDSTGSPVAGATAQLSTDNTYGAFYDNASSANDWNTGSMGTGTDGTIWFPTVLTDSVTVQVTPAADSSPSMYTLPIEAQTLTMFVAVVST
jgi:hypothetical protein